MSNTKYEKIDRAIARLQKGINAAIAEEDYKKATKLLIKLDKILIF